MTWYKSGTVACTLNSTTVTGAGTAFAANARVGDAYLGPDGRWYEVANIASDTVLSILPAYLGATVAAGIYALAPMQGYVKDSADALRALVNQYGAKLAALGTTGNYDILPVTKGGTGGTDQATARSGLGLGSTATENIVPVTKGGTGGTDQASARSGLGLGDASTANLGEALGNAMRVGAFGLGNSFGGGQQFSPDLNAGEIEYTRIIAYDDRTVATPTPSSGKAGVVLNLPHSRPSSGNNYGGQLAVDVVGSDVLFRTIAVTWTGWKKIYHTGNTTRAADGTLKAI